MGTGLRACDHATGRAPLVAMAQLSQHKHQKTSSPPSTAFSSDTPGLYPKGPWRMASGSSSEQGSTATETASLKAGAQEHLPKHMGFCIPLQHLATCIRRNHLQHNDRDRLGCSDTETSWMLFRFCRSYTHFQPKYQLQTCVFSCWKTCGPVGLIQGCRTLWDGYRGTCRKLGRQGRGCCSGLCPPSDVPCSSPDWRAALQKAL